MKKISLLSCCSLLVVGMALLGAAAPSESPAASAPSQGANVTEAAPMSVAPDGQGPSSFGSCGAGDILSCMNQCDEEAQECVDSCGGNWFQAGRCRFGCIQASETCNQNCSALCD